MTRLALLNIPEWTPRKLGNLELWYDATHIAGLSDGDAVTVWQDLANAGKPFYDPFTRADSATTLGAQWTASVGTWGIASNLAYVAVSSGATDRAVRDCGLADGVTYAAFTTVATTQKLVFRAVDADNELYVNAAATQWELIKVVTGTPSTIGTYVAVPANGDTVRVVANGSSLTVYINGTSRITATETFNQTATVCGIESVNTTTPRWNDFIVCKLTDTFQTTAAAKPTYKVNIRNGKPVVRFNGSQYLITAANSVLRNATGATALIVLQTTAPGTQANSLFIANNSAPARLTMLRERTGAGVLEVGGRRLDADAYAAINGASFTAGVWSVDTGILDYANSNAYLYTNGGLVAQTTSFQTDGNTSDTDSAGTAIGATVTGATAMNGDITEILVSSAALSDASRRRLENYVGKKYGITITW